MQPMQPIDTRPKERDFDYLDNARSGPSWGVLVAALLVVALLVGAVVVFGGNGSDGRQTPNPTEAPLDPGA